MPFSATLLAIVAMVGKVSSLVTSCSSCAAPKAELDTSSGVVYPSLQVLGRQVGEFRAHLPQPACHPLIVGLI